MWYRQSKKVIKAEDEKDPLGISDIKPTSLSDDPDVKKLNSLVQSGIMSESEFMDELMNMRPDLIQKMISISHLPNTHEIDRMVSYAKDQGINVNVKDRDILAKFYDITANVYVDFINQFESTFAYILRNMASKGQISDKYFLNIDDNGAGILLGDLIEPSTKEEYLSREYLELRSVGLDINEVIKIISNGDFNNINEAFNDFIEKYVDILAQKATRASGIQFYSEDILRKFTEKQINLDNLNFTVENTLVELYYAYKY